MFRLSSSIAIGSLIFAATAGAVFYIFRRRSRQQHTSSICVIDPEKIFVVRDAEQWERAYELLLKDMQEIKALGFDCEWVNSNGCSRPVSLVQFASVSGTCVLLQLQILALSGIPKTLKSLLSDRSIMKVGVACLDDGKRLERDFALRCEGCIDLRNVAHRCRIDLKNNGLKGMAKAVLGFELDKSAGLRVSDWEADSLTSDQVLYAARDAFSAICIFMKMINSKKLRANSQLSDVEISKRVASFCQGLIDLKYSVKSDRKKSSSVSTKVNKPDSIRSNADTSTRAYVTRKKPLYHNCQLISPDGQLLCTCDLKKAQWYLERDLGVKICDEPLKVQLKFEPAGRPVDENNYYLQQKDNVCVVCGKSDSYIRKNVIPHEYRKHFPAIMKEHKSHDIVLLCTSCHVTSNLHDGKLKQKLARMYSAEQTTGKHQHNSDLLKIKSAAKALMQNSSQIPQQRVNELQQLIRDYYGVQDINEAILNLAVNLETRINNDNFCDHGLKVVQHIIENEGLLEFERMWRQHFLDTMQPAYLPVLWSVDHSHSELINMGLEMKGAFSTHNLPPDCTKSFKK